ncbi:glycosyltransferase family 4 protein [Candidatus Uhrbacteria bacterium]|nr:glycosyltransferase family 4 protein [Candidatus Uhrbacteria bacterium]
MRIAVDARWMLNPAGGAFAGIPHYVDGVVRALLKEGGNHTFVLFVRDNIPQTVLDRLRSLHPTVDIRIEPYRRGSLWNNHFGFAKRVRETKADVLFAPAGQLPLGFRDKAVVTLHDFAIYRHPEWFPDRGLGRFFSMCVVVPWTMQRASGFISVSEFTKREAMDLFRISEKKIRIIPPVVEPSANISPLTQETWERFGLPGKYFLMVGTIEPRKNMAFAVQAFDRLLETVDDPDFRLAIVGKRGWKYEPTIAEIARVNRKWQERGRGEVVRELGYVTAEEKWALISGAQALLFPSLYEGFGIPVAEALSIGTRVISTLPFDVSSFENVVFQQTGLTDEGRFSAALREALDSVRTSPFPSENKFSSQEVAGQILEALENVTN